MLSAVILNVAAILGLASAASFDAAAMLTAVNSERQKDGKPALCYSSKLMTAAQKHSDYQASINQMTHDGPVPLGDRVRNQGYNYKGIAENVASMNDNNVATVMKTWMGSPGHRANILGQYTQLGVGLAISGGKYYWTQVFADPRDASEPCNNGAAPSPQGAPPSQGAPSQGAPPSQGTPPSQGAPPPQPAAPPENQPPMAPPPGMGGAPPQQPMSPEGGPSQQPEICIGGKCYAVVTNQYGEGFMPVNPPVA